MGIGATINNGLLGIASDIAGALFGVIVLVTVISGLLIVSGIGGQGIQKFVRQYIITMIWGVLLTGGANRIATGAISLFNGSGTGGA